MSAHDDRPTEMQPDHDREAAFEALLQGRDPGGAFGSLVSFADDVRAATGGPAPEPSAALAVLLRGGPADGAETQPARPVARLTGAGLRVKVALAAALAATSIAAAGATGLLPEPVADAVRPIVELVTPFEVPAPADNPRQQRPQRDRDVTVEPATDQGGAPATDPSASPGDPAGTGPAASSTGSSPATTAIAPLGSVTATPPGTAVVAPSSSIDGAAGAAAGSPAPETTESSHGGPPVPGTAPGRAGQPPATPRSQPPRDQGGDQAHTLSGPPAEVSGGPAAEVSGGPVVGTPARPDDTDPPDDAGGGVPAATELLTTTTDTVGAAPGSSTPEPPAARRPAEPRARGPG